MRTISVNLYQFSELSEEGKENAIEKWREKGIEYFWADEAFESLRKFCEEFNMDFHNASYSQYSIADCRTNNIDDNILELSGIRLRTYILNNHYDILFEPKHYGEYKKNLNSNNWKYKRYSRIQYIETSCPFTGYCGDEDLLTPIRNFIKTPNKSDFESLLTDCISSWVESANSDCEYQESDEAIIETIEANDYEFDSEGNLQ